MKPASRRDRRAVSIASDVSPRRAARVRKPKGTAAPDMSDALFDRLIKDQGKRIVRRALRALDETLSMFPCPAVRS